MVNEIENESEYTVIPLQEPEPEKLIKQSEVNQIAGSIRKESFGKGYDKGRQEILDQIQNSQNNSYTENGNGLNESQVRQIYEEASKEAMEKSDRNSREQEAHGILTEFIGKLELAKEKIPDLSDVITDLNLQNFPNLILMTNQLPNTAEVLYDLGKNPHKLANIVSIQNLSPELAKKELDKLSKSIQTNEQATSLPQDFNPLDKITPSVISRQSVGNKVGAGSSVSDFKKMPWLRG